MGLNLRPPGHSPQVTDRPAGVPRAQQQNLGALSPRSLLFPLARPSLTSRPRLQGCERLRPSRQLRLAVGWQREWPTAYPATLRYLELGQVSATSSSRLDRKSVAQGKRVEL